MLLYEVLAENDTKARLNHALEATEEARLAKLCHQSGKSSALRSSLSERWLALLEWQGTLRVRLGPAFDF